MKKKPAKPDFQSILGSLEGSEEGLFIGKFWRPLSGLLMSVEEMKKAGLATSGLPSNAENVSIGLKE